MTTALHVLARSVTGGDGLRCRALINMAAAADTETYVKILKFLKNGSSPKKALDIAEHLSITKSEANKHLYTMEKKKKVKKRGSSHWEVCCENASEEECQETSPLKNANTSLVPVRCTALIEKKVSTLMTPNFPLTGLELQILSYLKENGKRRTLEIAKGVGLQTRSDVNGSLYSLKEKGYLTQDNASWFIAGAKEETASAPTIINNFYMQNNPTNFICQQGPNNTISIGESQHTQIGSSNTMNTSTSAVVSERCLPSLHSIHGDAAYNAPEYQSSSVDAEEASPEKVTSRTPSQEVNITQSQLQNSMIGNSNIMVVNYNIDGPRRKEHSMESDENLIRNNSGFDADSLSDDTGSSSENGDITYTITRDQKSAQNITIRDSAVKNTVIANDTQVILGDGIDDHLSRLTSRLRLDEESHCRLDPISPSMSSLVSITHSRVKNANLGNDNYMTIENEKASPENSESEEEKDQKEEHVPNECGH
ncbi:Z-DNA-binding protein 1 isoform X1 [Lissotriton helveticus]